MSFDTRMRVFLLLDYNEYYGQDKSFEDAEELIKGIPSGALLNYVAGFNVNLYLNENNDDSGKIQFMLVSNLLDKCDKESRDKWVEVVKKQHKNGHAPIMFWNYSNLLFYNLIFKKYNTLQTRDITGDEAQKIFDAYLIINGVANNKIKVENFDVKSASDENKMEEITIPHFMYQKDYSSSLDFANQITRGVMLFEFLESAPKYNELVKEYYTSKKISGYLKMFKNILILFQEIRVEQLQRFQLINLEKYVLSNEIDLDYIQTLCINNSISNYTEDESFGTLRTKFLYQYNRYQYLILDVNFLIDQLYKAQVFSFNAFLKTKGLKIEFLSEKAKYFMEEIYLPKVIKNCFPHYESYFGDQCVDSKKEELCDVYIRENNKIGLFEFKDVLLNATVKNSGKKQTVFEEFDKKFIKNEKSKPKGITQLLNAIVDIEANSILFDIDLPQQKLIIYPVVLYTDHSFGVEGNNKIYREKFSLELEKLDIKNIEVKEITFINLNFFELREDYFAQKLMNLFDMFDSYHVHCSNAESELTPFEVFSRFYMNEHVPKNHIFSTINEELLKKIITTK